MKLKFLVVSLFCFLSISCFTEESILNKRITITFRKTPLSDVFKELEDKGGVKIVIDAELLQNQDLVHYNAINQEVGRVLTRILKPRGLMIESKDGKSVSVLKLPVLEEFRVKPEQVFEFTQKPIVTKDGDQITIAFETKGFCDATVVIEDNNGEIHRHLASGVLGENAPEPFQWNSKKQVLSWDGKNDKEEYVVDKNSCLVRVSLGLKSAYEKPLFWSPHKRIDMKPSLISSTPEGVYVFEAYTVDILKLFDHEGNYLRTIYPFPASKLNEVVGINKQTVLQTGQSLPHGLGSQQATLLTSGDSAINKLPFGGGIAATAMAVQGDRMALTYLFLNRLKTDGSSGGLALKGPATNNNIPNGTIPYVKEIDLGPSSVAFSPDGKVLYLTGYLARTEWGAYSRHGVYKMAYEKESAAEVFAGDMKPDGDGTDNAHFAVPNSVACDAKGRVYVADFLNNRIQIYDADGKFLKTIATPYPAKVQVDPKTQDIYVYSWNIGAGMTKALVDKYKLLDGDYLSLKKIKPTMIRFGSFDDSKELARWDLPSELMVGGSNLIITGQVLTLEMDFWAKQPTLWLSTRQHQLKPEEHGHYGIGGLVGRVAEASADAGSGIIMLVLDGNQWKPNRKFADDARKSVARLKPPDFGIQRLSVSEKTHKLYVLEHNSFSKCNDRLIEIDPVTGKSQIAPLTFATEDICFDRDGLIYLRTDLEVVRYDPTTWREVPWDYGVERKDVGFAGGKNDILSALPLPGGRPVMYHQSGMWVSAKGHIAVACNNPDGGIAAETADSWSGLIKSSANNIKSQPIIYPGRSFRLPNVEVHIWDKHGKLIKADAVPGLGYCNGLGIDKDDNIYALLDSWRQLGDKTYPNQGTGTLIKFRPPSKEFDSVQILSTDGCPVPLTAEAMPKRKPDTVGGNFVHGNKWMNGTDWYYGGAGNVGLSCTCYHTRFCLDTFARTFVPEPDLYSVAVLDSSGNLITRIGKYGNTDDGIALVPNPAIPNPRSIGGDEVPLFYPAYVGVDSDRRLFISDIGNARIVSVKLGYQADAKVELKNIPDQKQK